MIKPRSQIFFIVSYILYSQNFACQFENMFYLQNLVTNMTYTVSLKAINLLYMLSKHFTFLRSRFYYFSHRSFCGFVLQHCIAIIIKQNANSQVVLEPSLSETFNQCCKSLTLEIIITMETL